MQTIISTYVQELSTIHPDLVINVYFKYKAIVHDDEGETVEVHSVVYLEDHWPIGLSTDQTVPSVDRFLACIREDARKKAYEQRKKNNIQ